jgi:hypothetical protein
VSVSALVEAVRAEQAARYVPSVEMGDGPPRVAVRSAHPGAGGTTVALSIFDALGQYGELQRTLIDLVGGPRSGLAGATEIETESAISGWRRGLRLGAQVLRPAQERFGLPPEVGGKVIIDSSDSVSAASVVVVCRATLPSLQLADVLIGSGTLVAHLAIAGARTWPKELRRALPDRVAAMDADDAITFFPAVRRLEIFGLDHEPMPRELMSAGARVAEHVWPDFTCRDTRRPRRGLRR